MGDNFVPRAECANLINTRQMGIDYSKKNELFDLAEERGRYFYENDKKQRLYSKYGIGYTLLYMVPLWAEKRHSGKLDLLCNTPSQLAFLNIYNVLFTLFSTVYFYQIVSLYTSKSWQKITFILVSYYTTFLWHYLRSPTLEVYQLLPFLGFYYHMACFLRKSRISLRRDARIWKHLFMAVCFVGILLSLKLFFGLLFIVIGVLATTVPGWGSLRDAFKRAFRNLSEFKRQYLLYLILPSFLFIFFVLAVNHCKFGSIFQTGYGQWLPGASKTPATGAGTEKMRAPDAPESENHEKGGGTAQTHDTKPEGNSPYEGDRFGTNPLAALRGFFLAKGNTNAFVHYPLFFFALFGMRRFAKKFPVDSCLILFLFGLITLGVASFSGWKGEWCYGPRHLLLVLVIGSLPFLEVMDRAGSFKPLLKCCAVGVVACVLGWSLVMQVYMNSLSYFAFYVLRAPWTQFKQEKVDAYFNNTFHRGLIHRDFIRYIRKGKPYFPLETVKSTLSPPDRDRLSRLTERRHIAWMAKPNYYFCQTKKGLDSR